MKTLAFGLWLISIKKVEKEDKGLGKLHLPPMASRYKKALLMVVRTFWSALEVNAGQINGIEGIQDIEKFDADWFVREALRKGDLEETRNGKRGTQYTLNRSARNVIEAALAAGRIAGEDDAYRKAGEIVGDAEMLELVCLELGEVGGWFSAEEVIGRICVVLGLVRSYWVETSIDLLLLSLSKLASKLIERQIRSGGGRVYRVAGTESSDGPVGEGGGEPVSDDDEEEEEDAPPVQDGDGFQVGQETSPGVSQSSMSYSDLAATVAVQVMIVRIFFDAVKGNLISATEARALIVRLAGWEGGTPQGIGRMLGAIARITGYLGYHGEGHDRAYYVTAKAGTEVLGLTEDECRANGMTIAVPVTVPPEPEPEPEPEPIPPHAEVEEDVEVVQTVYGRRVEMEDDDLSAEGHMPAESAPMEPVVDEEVTLLVAKEGQMDDLHRRLEELERFRASILAVGAGRLRRVLKDYPKSCWQEMATLALEVPATSDTTIVTTTK